MRNTLDKGDLLSLFKFKVPNALKLATIIREIPTALPKPAKKVLLAYYFSKYSEVRGEFEVERCVRLLNFLTEGLEIHNYEQEAVEILAPPVENCINCNKALVAQNQICSVTVFLRNYLKSAMKFSSCCKDCNLNYGYSNLATPKMVTSFMKNSVCILRQLIVFSQTEAFASFKSLWRKQKLFACLRPYTLLTATFSSFLPENRSSEAQESYTRERTKRVKRACEGRQAQAA